MRATAMVPPVSNALNQKNILRFDGENQYLRVADFQTEESYDLDLGSEVAYFYLSVQMS